MEYSGRFISDKDCANTNYINVTFYLGLGDIINLMLEHIESDELISRFEYYYTELYEFLSNYKNKSDDVNRASREALESLYDEIADEIMKKLQEAKQSIVENVMYNIQNPEPFMPVCKEV